MNLLGSPDAGLVVGRIVVGFVLNRERVKIDAVGVLHIDHVTSELVCVSLVIGRGSSEAATVEADHSILVGGFERRLRSPWRAPNSRAPISRHLHNTIFDSGSAGGNA